MESFTILHITLITPIVLTPFLFFAGREKSAAFAMVIHRLLMHHKKITMEKACNKGTIAVKSLATMPPDLKPTARNLVYGMGLITPKNASEVVIILLVLQMQFLSSSITVNTKLLEIPATSPNIMKISPVHATCSRTVLAPKRLKTFIM